MKPFFYLVLALWPLSGYAAPAVHHSYSPGMHLTYTAQKYEVKHSLGLKRDVKAFKAFKQSLRHKYATVETPVPKQWDLTLKVSPPEDQGSCGSCWAFSIVKALRSALMLAGHDPGRLAFNYLLNNCGGVVSEYGCRGGDFPAARNCVAGKGPWLEGEDPYTAREGRCKQGLPVAGTALSWVLVGDGRTAPSFKQLAAASFNVGRGHMLSIDVDASSGGWANYRGGIYNRNAGASIDHMINLVGYDCESSVDSQGYCTFNQAGQPTHGDGFLIVQNNWGNDWGESGYMRTRWGMNAIAETAMYFEVEQPEPVPSPTPSPSPVPSPSPSPDPVPSPDAPSPWWVWVVIGLGVVAVLVYVVKKELKPKA